MLDVNLSVSPPFISFRLRVTKMQQLLEGNANFFMELEGFLTCNPRRILFDLGFAGHPDVIKFTEQLGGRRNWDMLAASIVYRCDKTTTFYQHTEQKQLHEQRLQRATPRMLS